jgi:hypothetical protein
MYGVSASGGTAGVASPTFLSRTPQEVQACSLRPTIEGDILAQRLADLRKVNC